MNRRARLRTRTLPSGKLFHYYRDTDPKVDLDGYDPDYVFKRLWMGIAPPEGDTPGYCCIVGEGYDPDARLDKPSFVLVDEASYLEPADFTDFTGEEQKQFGITAEAAKYPTQEDLRDAAIALKDLYHPELCWCVPAPAFMAYLRRGEGLSWYDEVNYHLWPQRFPLLRQTYYSGPPHRRERHVRTRRDPHTVGIVGDGPDTPDEDREYGIVEVKSLLAKKRLEIVRYFRYDEAGNVIEEVPCLFSERRDQWPSIYRAVSWVIFSMSRYPLVI